jgi:hypothetical protein
MEDSAKKYQQMQELKKKNQQLSKKVTEIEGYLNQYGIRWVDNRLEGKLNDKAIKR